MARTSAGVLLYRSKQDAIEVLLVHPGGPLWARRDSGSWSIPKGEVDPNEDPRQAAAREFAEELGAEVPAGQWKDLGEVSQGSRKRVRAWAVEGNLDPSRCKSNHFEMQWPPRSGRVASFPEVDRVEWFELAEARKKLVSGQLPLLDRLEELLRSGQDDTACG